MILRLVTIAAATLVPTGQANARQREVRKTAAAPDKLICKRDDETGSLVKATKRCYTRRDWDRMAEGARGTAERLNSDNTASLAPGS